MTAPLSFIFSLIKNQVTYISYEQRFRHIHQFIGFDGFKLSKKRNKQKTRNPIHNEPTTICGLFLCVLLMIPFI